MGVPPAGRRGMDATREGSGPLVVGPREARSQVVLRGLWAPRENVAAARVALEAERATPAYAKKREADLARRERTQAAYVVEFEDEVRGFLRFSPRWFELGRVMARQVAAHATPVGSGTVARTKRIGVAERAEAAVIAWMRHQTTAYDCLSIPRVAGMRREVRRDSRRSACAPRPAPARRSP